MTSVSLKISGEYVQISVLGMPDARVVSTNVPSYQAGIDDFGVFFRFMHEPRKFYTLQLFSPSTGISVFVDNYDIRPTWSCQVVNP